MSTTQKDVVNVKEGGRWWTGLLQATSVPILVAGGWFLHSMIPTSAPPDPGGLGGPASTPTVVTERIREGAAAQQQEFFGRIEAIQTVDLVAQVAGYIEEVHFEEGSLVEAGTLLFRIERAPYEARVALATAALRGAESNIPATRAELSAATANLERAEKYLARLRNADKRSVVQASLDAASADFLQAQAQVRQADSAVQQAEAVAEQASANLGLAQIDLGYTEVRAPISGRIGRAKETRGNYVNPANGPLARIVQMDPVRVVFSLPDREYVTLMQAVEEEGEASVETRLLMANGTQYAGSGARDFADNEMDPQTGTIAMRARFRNEKGLLVPQSYVTVMLERKGDSRGPLVPEHAVMTDQQGPFVYVVDGEDRVEVRRVVLGAASGGIHGVEGGLMLDERVIVQGIQKVSPGQLVQTVGAEDTPQGV